MKRRTWIWSALAGTVLAAFAAAYVLQPQFGLLVRTASSALNTGEFSSARMFIGTWGRGSVLSVIVLGIWQAVSVVLPHEALVRAAADLFGPIVGPLASWAGLVLGALIAFGISRALVGVPLTAARERRGPLAERRGIARWVLLGLRLVPFVPQDLVSYAFGASRVSIFEFTWITAVGTVPTVAFFSVFSADVPGGALRWYTVASSLAGVAVLGWIAWRERARIPVAELSAPRKRQLAVSAALVVAAAALYAFIPGVRAWVSVAIDVLARGDVAYVRDYLLGFGVWAPAISALLMVLQSLAAPLPAFVVTFANGLLFGWAWGALLSWSSAMAGAALCFWIARSLGRPAVERLVGGSRAVGVSDLFFERYGDRAVLIARLLPFVSFDIISYGAGLTSMGFWRFFIATGIGQLPATLVYSYLGQNLTGSVRILFFIFVFTAAVFVAAASLRPWFMRRLKARVAHGEATASGPTPGATRTAE